MTDAEASGSSQQVPDIPEMSFKGLIAYTPDGRPYGINASLVYVGDVYSDVGGFFPDDSFAEHGSYTIIDLSGFYEFGRSDRQRVVVRIENLLDEDYATSVRTTQSDTGETYLYDNLGVPRTLHVSYTLAF